MVDLFEQWETLPPRVKNVLTKFEDVESYVECEELVKALNKVGYTCEYQLDAQPFNLRELTVFDGWSKDKIDSVFECMLDEVSNNIATEIRKEVRTTEEKIIYFIDCEKKFSEYLVI